MRKGKTWTNPFVAILAVPFVFALFSLGYPMQRLLDKWDFHIANQARYQEILSKGSGIRPFSQFVEIFRPASASEFFDNATLKEVESIAMVAEVHDGYEASFVAPVLVNRDGQYQLQGQPVITITDLRGGSFTKVFQNGSSSGSSIRLGPVLWNRFVASGGDIESLREVKVHSRDA